MNYFETPPFIQEDMRRPFGFGRPGFGFGRPGFGYGRPGFFGPPFLGGFAGGLLAGSLLAPGYGYPYPPPYGPYPYY
ncbi:spore coat protein [Bacillus zhangzhouensis]|uniref:spore coat protein n=1 Tax=Bacillus zhangzhouensis TaxID=1178540 RepID=UPI002E1EE1DF|nr:spore coat protein [Bacillus zhangzhouensis]